LHWPVLIPDDAEVGTDVYAIEESVVREITYREALAEALNEEMALQPDMIVIKKDVLPGGTLHMQGFRIKISKSYFESPISEASIVGVALGAALTGWSGCG
jgi:pyruvate/2-oxoglutarate/acetoin dehydrogenase E1 component